MKKVFTESGLDYPDIEYPQRNGKSVRRLGLGEQGRLLAECAVSQNPHLQTLAILVIETGLRKKEALALKWDDIDPEGLRLTVRRCNGDSPRKIELTETAAEVIRAHAARFKFCGDYVFPAIATGRRDPSERALNVL